MGTVNKRRVTAKTRRASKARTLSIIVSEKLLATVADMDEQVCHANRRASDANAEMVRLRQELAARETQLSQLEKTRKEQREREGALGQNIAELMMKLRAADKRVAELEKMVGTTGRRISQGESQ